MRSSVKPLLFGYLRLRVTAGLAAAEAGKRLLKEFANEEGFALVDVFIDADESRPHAALEALIRCIRSSDTDLRGVAVAVPHLKHLGADPKAQRRVRARIEHETYVRVIVVLA